MMDNKNAKGVSHFSPGLPRSGYPGIAGKTNTNNPERVVPWSVSTFVMEIRHNPDGVETRPIPIPQGSRFAATLGRPQDEHEQP